MRGPSGVRKLSIELGDYSAIDADGPFANFEGNAAGLRQIATRVTHHIEEELTHLLARAAPLSPDLDENPLPFLACASNCLGQISRRIA